VARITIPEKIYFKIGEVSKLLDLEPYVLRYWETEFTGLKPEKTRTGQRSYRRQDIELLVSIKHLLYEDLFTIAGARQRLKQMKKEGQSEPLIHTIDALESEIGGLKKELEPLRMALSPLQKRNDALERENRAVKAAYNELEKKTDALAAENTSVVKTRASTAADAELKLTESRRIVGRQAGELVRVEKERKELSERLFQNEEELKGLRLENRQLLENQKDAEALSQLENRLEYSLKRVASLEGDKRELINKASTVGQRRMRGFLGLRRELEGLLEMAN